VFLTLSNPCIRINRKSWRPCYQNLRLGEKLVCFVEGRGGGGVTCAAGEVACEGLKPTSPHNVTPFQTAAFRRSFMITWNWMTQRPYVKQYRRDRRDIGGFLRRRYRVTSRLRKRLPVGPYNSPMPTILRGS